MPTRAEFRVYLDTMLRVRNAIVVAIRKIRQSEQRDYQQWYLAWGGQIFLDAPPHALETFIVSVRPGRKGLRRREWVKTIHLLSGLIDPHPVPPFLFRAKPLLQHASQRSRCSKSRPPMTWLPVGPPGNSASSPGGSAKHGKTSAMHVWPSWRQRMRDCGHFSQNNQIRPNHEAI